MAHLANQHYYGDKLRKCPHCSKSIKKSKASYHSKTCKAKVKETVLKPVPLESDDTEDHLKCEGCDLNVAMLEDAFRHLKDLCKDFKSFNFDAKMVFQTTRFRCPICSEHNFQKKSEARLHILTHVDEIHNNVTACGICARKNVHSNV